MNPARGVGDPIQLEEVGHPGAGGYLVVLAVHQMVQRGDTGNKKIHIAFVITISKLIISWVIRKYIKMYTKNKTKYFHVT